MSDRWISTPEYMAKYGVCRESLYHWVRDGKIRAIRKGRRWFFLDPMVMELANPESRVVTAEDLQPLLRGKEAAEFAGLSPRMLRRYAQDGKVGFRTVGRRRRYSIQDIRDIMAVRLYNKNRPTRQEKRMTIMEWARTRLAQKP